MRGLPTSSTSARNLIAHPYFRPILCVVGFIILMQSIKSQWSSLKGGKTSGSGHEGLMREKLVVAHFMLGNTYPFTEDDWHTTFDQVEETGLDALALNIGPEEWQHSQGLSAFKVLSSRSNRYSPPAESSYAAYRCSSRKLQLFISMDMNVLPKWTAEDGDSLKMKMKELLEQDGYLRWDRKRILSSFSGHDATFGGKGWEGWLADLKKEIGEEVFFWPSFFLPPDTLLAMPHIGGIFNWNAAWPLTKTPTSLIEDNPFLPSSSSRKNSNSQKAYMTSVSPLFFTHYGTTGQWAWNKNWIFPSDKLLYPTRWTQLLSLEEEKRPDIIQVISWNDHGESHAIGPVLGAQPGSEAWTDGMDHEAFRSLTGYFIDKWRGGDGVREGEMKIWMWYRTHPKDLVAEGDEVGRPDKADWAEDLINLVVAVPGSITKKEKLEITTRNGEGKMFRLDRGKTNLFTIPFRPGNVEVEVEIGDKIVLQEKGRVIDGAIDNYNFNIWSGAWTVDLQ